MSAVDERVLHVQFELRYTVPLSDIKTSRTRIYLHTLRREAHESEKKVAGFIHIFFVYSHGRRFLPCPQRSASLPLPLECLSMFLLDEGRLTRPDNSKLPSFQLEWWHR
jgi:hypothetical protein